MAFGEHTYEEAVKLAASKTKELGRKCTVIPAEAKPGGTPGLYTIGIEVKMMTGADLVKRIKEGSLKNGM
jgi:hypothetical protein